MTMPPKKLVMASTTKPLDFVEITPLLVIGTTISSGGQEIVEAGGTSSNTIISSGGLLLVMGARRRPLDIASAAGLREKIADLSGHRFDPINTPIGQPDRSERQATIARRHQLRPCNDYPGSALRLEPGRRAPVVHRLACGCDE
jgi:autotransporter passenger strand-loop-strand repeat protein